MKRGAAILLQRALRNQQGEQLALGHVHRRKRVYGMRITIRLNLRIEFDRQIEPVAHERNVAHHGLAGNLQRLHELRAVHERAAPQLVMDFQHALEWRSRQLGPGKHGNFRTEFSGWDKQCPTPGRKMRAMKPTRRRKICSVPLALAWSHCGVPYRVTAWPEVQFERL